MEQNGFAINGFSQDAKDMLFIAGGLALIALGAGLLMGHPDIRRVLSNPDMRQTLMARLGEILPGIDLQDPLKSGLAGLLPDIERYIKAKSM